MAKTFRINLDPTGQMGHLFPGTLTEASNFKNAISSWLPDYIRTNYDLKHDDEFTVVSQIMAKYLVDNYTTGTNPLLTVI